MICISFFVTVCARKTYGNDDYYCDRDLMQRLVFDASVSENVFGYPWQFTNEWEEELVNKYNASLRFIAAMSGLTRWQYIHEDENNTDQ